MRSRAEVTAVNPPRWEGGTETLGRGAGVALSGQRVSAAAWHSQELQRLVALLSKEEGRAGGAVPPARLGDPPRAALTLRP